MVFDWSASPSGSRRQPRPPRLSDRAAAHVRELIISGQLVPGEFVRPETVADETGMSATPVREGLLQLQGEGFLKIKPRRGFAVMPLSVQDILDAFEAQALLGGELCARAAARIGTGELRAVEEIQKRLERASAASQLAQVEELNFEFHRSIYSHADAPLLHRLLGFTVRYAPRKFYPTIEGWPEATNRDHRAILKALRAGNSEAARRAMASHVRGAGELLAKHIGSRRSAMTSLYGGALTSE